MGVAHNQQKHFALRNSYYRLLDVGAVVRLFEIKAPTELTGVFDSQDF